MSLSLSKTAYSDCLELFERALGTPRGVQRLFDLERQAIHFRDRMNSARKLDRKNNRAIYADEPEHPLYARSEFDVFTIRIARDFERDKWLVRVELLVLDEADIEEIPPTNSPIDDVEGLEDAEIEDDA
jgi:hypothetical protein